jgi:hypothetical protein
MTFIKDVFLKGNLQVNQFILNGMKNIYFSEDIIKSSPVGHIVQAIVEHDAYDFTMESESSEDEVSHRYIAFKQNTDTNLITIDLVKKGPLKAYIQQIRHPKQMQGYELLMETLKTKVDKKHSDLLCKLLPYLQPNSQLGFCMDTQLEEDECSVSIECLRSRLWVNLSIDLKEFKKLK